MVLERQKKKNGKILLESKMETRMIFTLLGSIVTVFRRLNIWTTVVECKDNTSVDNFSENVLSFCRQVRYYLDSAVRGGASDTPGIRYGVEYRQKCVPLETIISIVRLRTFDGRSVGQRVQRSRTRKHTRHRRIVCRGHEQVKYFDNSVRATFVRLAGRFGEATRNLKTCSNFGHRVF